jgi:hypothetical protein
MSFILRIIAVVAFALATVGVPTYNVPMLPLGLALWCLSTVVEGK